MNKTVIADDHGLVRAGIRELLAQLDTVEVVAEATNGIEAVSLVKHHQPELLIVDIAMPYANGIEVLEEVKRWSPHTRTVVLTGMTSITLLKQAALAGANGIYQKSGDAEELLSAIPLILAGAVQHSKKLAEAFEKLNVSSKLSRRELQVFQCLARGENLNEIAAKLCISRNTVDKHRTAVMRKLEVHTSAELMAVAYREGMLETIEQL